MYECTCKTMKSLKVKRNNNFRPESSYDFLSYYLIDKFLTDRYLWKQGSETLSRTLFTEHCPEFRIVIVKASISTGSSKSMVKPTGFPTVDNKECLIEFQKEKKSFLF